MWQIAKIVAVGLVLMWSASAFAQEPADNMIKGAMQDLDRFEGEAAGLDPNRKSNIKRMQKFLGLTRQRLDQSNNQSDPSWVAANARLVALQQHLEALLTGQPVPAPAQAETAPAPAPATAEPAPAPAEAAPAVAEPAQPAGDGGGELSSLEKTQLSRVRRAADGVKNQISSANPVALQDPAAQQALRDKIGAVRASLAQMGKAGNPDIQAQAAKIDALDGLLDQQIQVAASELTPAEREEVEALAKRIDNAWRSIKNVNIGALQAEGAPGEYDAGVARLEGLHQALPKQDHPRVKEIGGWLVEARDMLNERLAIAADYTEKYGNIPATFTVIRDRYSNDNLPDPLGPPLTPESAAAWVTGITGVMGELDNDMQYLHAVKDLGVIHKDQMSSALFWVGTDSRRKLEEMLVKAVDYIDGTIVHGERLATFIEETDAQDQNHIANRLLGEGQFENYMQQLQDSRHDVLVAKAFDQALGRTDAGDRNAQEARFDAAMERFQMMVETALTEIRMPKIRSDDPELLEIAAEVLSDPGHKVNPYERMIVSYDVHRKEKREGTIMPGSVTTTITVYHYEWDEFNVTTAEKVGDKYYMYANKFKYFLSGDQTTPTNIWILSDRFQSSQILEENIHK